MFRVKWDRKINGILLTTKRDGDTLNLSPRPVFYEELDFLGFNKKFNWKYPKSKKPLLWALDRRFYYKGELVAEVKGGNIFDDPGIEITKAGKNLKLSPINIKRVIEKNQEFLFRLEQEAIEFIEETYREYSRNNRVDYFIVSYSGGKDSQVVLDLVSRVIPPEQFRVIYSDTGIELPVSIEMWEITKKHYTAKYPELIFHLTRSPQKDTVELWKKFGIPSRIHRWCCTVLKTAPMYRDLKFLKGNGRQPTLLVFEGVRAEESFSRARYDRKLGKNVKHFGVINASPIYYWNTIEVFLYLFGRKLPINKGYRLGLNRVGCFVCPFASELSEYIINGKYPKKMLPFLNLIKSYCIESGIKDVNEYIKKGKWKTRAGGLSLKNQKSRVDIIEKNGELKAYVSNPSEDILEWIKVLGPRTYQKTGRWYSGEIKFNEIVCKFSLEISSGNNSVKAIFKNIFNFPSIMGKVKGVLNKTSLCTHCSACEVECPNGALIVVPRVKVDLNKCVHCWKCIDFIDKGCIVAKSLYITDGGNQMKNKSASLNRYEGFGIKENWIEQYFRNINNFFEIDNNLGGNPQIRAFINWLKDGEIIGKNVSEITDLGKLIQKIYLNNPLKAWQILWVNFYYNSLIIRWYIESIPYNSIYSKDELTELLKESYPELQPRTRNNAINSLLYLFKYSIISKMKLGKNEKKGTTTYISKMPYDEVDLTTVAYSLYRYANNKNRYNFTVSELYAPEQKQGIYKEFGVSKERFNNILRTLQENKYGIIKVNLVKGLDNISLREDLTYIEVLKLLLGN